MNVLTKLFFVFIILAVFVGASFPNLSPKYQGINFIKLNAEEHKNTNDDVGASIVEAQTQRFFPSQELMPYDGKVPVLMYHVIGNEYYKIENENIVKTESFEEQMQWLHDNGYNTITPEQLYNFIKEKAPLPPKPIILTFDDGNIDSYTTVFPILKKYNFTSTMFIITKAIGSKGRVNEEQIAEMIDYGITIGSHTVSHLNLASLSKDEMRKEIIDSKKILERTFGVPINYVCYPAGRYDDLVLDIVKEAKYLGAFTTHFGRVGYGDDPTTLVRVRINRSDEINGFIQKVEKAKTYPFTTPHHGDKKNRTPIDEGELGLDNPNINKDKDKGKNKIPTGNNLEEPKADNDNKGNPNGDQTPNNDNSSDDKVDNGNDDSSNPDDGNNSGTDPNNQGNTNNGSDANSSIGSQSHSESKSPSQLLIKRIQNIK